MALPRITPNVITCIVWVTVFACCGCALVAERKKEQEPTDLIIRQASSAAGFIQLVVMRFLFGIASWAGIGDWAAGLFNGVLVPPGSDYDYSDDYRDEYDGEGDDDDYY